MRGAILTRCAAGFEALADEDIPVVRIAFERTVRLVTTARLRAAVLASLVKEEDIGLLAEIEGATSQRLLAENSSAGPLVRDDLVHGVPFASFINASFAYFKPGQPNRFNEDRGAWYSALEVEVCIAEVAWHMSGFLAQAGRMQARVDYAELYASMAGNFMDLRDIADHPALHPDPAIGYAHGNLLAQRARAEGLNGIIYPSVRYPGGVCVVALIPHAVQSVAQGGVYRLIWAGAAQPSVNKIA
jgi:RES domain-containing protein